jgi:imidazolonepropionase-like amidohydrolase
MPKSIYIHASELYDGKTKLKDRTIEVKDGHITSITKGRSKAASLSGVVTPGFIDAHSHIGMMRAGEPGSEAEGNDITQQIMPLSDPLNSVYFDDSAFAEAIDFGVLYSCIMPGSGNLLGGRTRVIKNFARHKGEALLKDHGFKMALGFNPRSTQGWRGDRPNTRMGIYALLERRFDEVLGKEKRAALTKKRKLSELAEKKDLSKKEARSRLALIDAEHDLEFSPDDSALLDLLHGRKPAKIHVHKEDDVIYLIELVKKYGLRASAEHSGDVWHQEIFELLAANNIPIIYGPLGSHPYKIELKHSHYANAKLLMHSGATFGLMTDHPVIQASNLRDCLKYFLIQGMGEVEAIGLVTTQNAKILGVDSDIGHLAPGKIASLLVWNGNPLHLASMPVHVMAEGAFVRGGVQGS